MNPHLFRGLGFGLALLGALLLAGGAAAQKPLQPPQPPQNSNNAQNRLLIVGSSTMAPLITELAKQFCLAHPNIAIEVRSGGSGFGVGEANAGRADIGMASRALHADEKALFAFTLARDGVALVVHRDNPVRDIARAHVSDALTGRIANWQALGGADAPVAVVSRRAGHSSLEIVSGHFGLGADAIKATATVADNTAALAAAAGNRNTLTFFSVGLAEHEAERGTPVKALALDGIPATSATVREGRYPLTRPLNLVTRAIPTGATRAFIEFTLSAAAQKTIEQHDFVPFVNFVN